jgi:hypothetical protein
MIVVILLAVWVYPVLEAKNSPKIYIFEQITGPQALSGLGLLPKAPEVSSLLKTP